MARKLAILVFALALATRIYQLPSRAIFTADEEYQATYAQTIVKDFHPIWIGVSAADTGFYLGPYFTYLTALLLKINSDPVFLNYATAVLGAITAALLYLLASSIYGKRVGFFAGVLYAASPLMVYFDQRYWNPSAVPFLTVFLLYALYQMEKNAWWLVGVAASLGAFWHVHLSLVPLTLIAIVWVYRERKNIKLKVWLVSIFTFILMLLPLMIFDYYHAWSNILTPVRMLQHKSVTANSLSLGDKFAYLGTTLARTLYLQPGFSSDAEVKFNCIGENTNPIPIFGFVALLAFIYFIFAKKKESFLLGGASLVLSLAFILYPGPISSYYALGLFPLFFLALGYLFKRVVWLLIPLFIVISLITLVRTDSGYSLAIKKSLISQAMNVVQDQPFSVIEQGTCHAYAGWRYLFVSYGRKPASSSADSSLGWLYPGEIESKSLYNIYLGDKDEFIGPASAVSVFEVGHYRAFITKN